MKFHSTNVVWNFCAEGIPRNR